MCLLRSTPRTPLKISSFTLDDYESALRYTLSDPPCALIAEINCCLMAIARERPGQKNIAHESIRFYEGQQNDTEIKDQDGATELDIDGVEKGVGLSELFKASRGMGEKKTATWDTAAAKENGRPGWEDALVIFIRDVSRPASFLRPTINNLALVACNH